MTSDEIEQRKQEVEVRFVEMWKEFQEDVPTQQGQLKAVFLVAIIQLAGILKEETDWIYKSTGIMLGFLQTFQATLSPSLTEEQQHLFTQVRDLFLKCALKECALQETKRSSKEY